MTQSEQEVEQNLIQRLTGLGYEPVTLSNAAALTANLKTQLEKHNGIKLSDTEFKSILVHTQSTWLEVLMCYNRIRTRCAFPILIHRLIDKLFYTV